MKKPLGLRLEESLIARIDAVRGGVSRTAFVEGAIERELGGSPGTVRSPFESVSDRARAVERANVADRRPLSARVQSSADAKAGVVPRWRGTGTDGSA